MRAVTGQEAAAAKPTLAIRRATEEDITEIVLLERETATAPHWAVADYAAMLRRPGSGGLQRVLFTAAEGRNVCGFAVGKVLRVGREIEAELESVVVHAGMRRQGVGSTLCRAVMEWAREEHAGRILLEVRAGSAGAVRLYGGLGFVATGRRPGYYHNPVEDAVLMRCTLRRAPARRPAGAGVGGAEPEPFTGRLDV